MTARQTIIRVRGDETDLAAAVASLVPSEIAHAKRTIQRTTVRGIRTTFCPLCGGNKGKTAMRCGDCRDRAMRDGATAARVRGHRSQGTRNASRSLIGVAVAKDNPNHGDYQPQAPTWSRRVRGEGRPHVQDWDRKVLFNGEWMSESLTPEGQERRRAENEVIRRLESAR